MSHHLTVKFVIGFLTLVKYRSRNAHVTILGDRSRNAYVTTLRDRSRNAFVTGVHMTDARCTRLRP